MQVVVQFMVAIQKMPFSENDNVDHPVSLYAATKKSNELMAHTYIICLGLSEIRFSPYTDLGKT